MPPAKRARDNGDKTSLHSDASDSASDDDAMDVAGSQGEEEGDSSTDTDDEIAAGGKQKKSKQTLKRKRRATEPSRFGETLQSLLNTETPSAAPLSLKPSIARRHNDEKLELKAKKVLQVERKDKEDKGRITDILDGWGAEGERALRKVAQRGVVRLFNAIQQAQTSSATAAKDKSSRGTGKASLQTPSLETGKGDKKAKGKDNILGRGKEAAVDKDDFFDLIRSGGVVSKA